MTGMNLATSPPARRSGATNNPLENIEALREVAFVMKKGKVVAL
jgi:hypothetical protein